MKVPSQAVVLICICNTASSLSSPLLRHAGVHRAQVDLPLVLQLQVGVAEDPHKDAGAHVVDPSLRGAHGDLDLVAGLLVGVFRDVGWGEEDRRQLVGITRPTTKRKTPRAEQSQQKNPRELAANRGAIKDNEAKCTITVNK